MSETENAVPVMDHQESGTMNGQTEAELLDAVIRQSGFGLTDEEPLPEEEIAEVDPQESDVEEDPEESDDGVSDESDEDSDAEAEEVDGEESPTETDAYALEDLDEEFKIKLTVDGEEKIVSVADLAKSYGTEQSHSKKGRELGEARKQFEEEKAEQLQQLEELANVASVSLYESERSLSEKYHELETKIAKAKEEGDTFEASELRDQKDEVQKKYWEARKKREGLQQAVVTRKQQEAAAAHQEQLEHFSNVIHEYIPDFNEETAGQIREFALNEGIPESLINTVVDPQVVKFIDDYRRLKQNVSKGVAKRKAKGKAIPTKKMPSEDVVKAKKAEARKQRALSEEASPDEQMDFLRNYASQTLSNL